MEEELQEIIRKITEHYDTPIKIGSICEAQVFYRVEDLSARDVETCATYISDRVSKVVSPNLPQILVNLSGNYSGLADSLAKKLAPPGEELEVAEYEKVNIGNGYGKRLKDSQVILVNDVITTARSCLEAHTKITMAGASILCWAALIDRTFGPGPVPVVAAVTGEPVTLLAEPP